MMTFETIFFGIYALIVGLCVGSFLNVVALRAFSEESIVLPPSKCPKCNNKLKWYHNIPLFSYLFLRGKCAYCKCQISIQYPIVELLTGIMFLLSFLIFGLSLNTLFAWIFIAFLIVMSITDIKETVVFNTHVYSFIVVMYLISLIAYPINQWWQGLLGILVAFIVFEIVARMGYLITNSRIFGEGDTYIAMGIGAILGPIGVLVVALLAVVVATIFMYPVMLYNSIKNKNKDMIIGLAIVPFIVIAGILFNLYSTKFNVYLLYLFLVVAVLAPALYAIYLILKDVRKRKVEDLMMPPFGPALAVAGVIIYFLMGILSI